MPLLGSTENETTQNKNGENVPNYRSSISSLQYCQ